jgi:hypothetical protein
MSVYSFYRPGTNYDGNILQVAEDDITMVAIQLS